MFVLAWSRISIQALALFCQEHFHCFAFFCCCNAIGLDVAPPLIWINYDFCLLVHTLLLIFPRKLLGAAHKLQPPIPRLAYFVLGVNESKAILL